MAFRFSTGDIRENRLVFIYEECAYPGVRRIAGRVREDIRKVFSAKPIGVEYADFFDTAGFFKYPVFFGTVGNSSILDDLAADNVIDLFDIAGEREVYSLNIIDGLRYKGFSFESAIVIAGSDKRGTIYGLFALSELLGVSAFTDWLDIKPPVLDEYLLTPADSFVSKKPSVKYRGFFINDEWPAFGNWCNKNFGGFNAKAYARVFELLLRLKGNLLWPAMWSAVFSDDGPNLASCALADELGVIMGTSHHEPCMRQGEEYSHVRGADSVYGDAWDFRANREGITRFWKDGLEKRSGFENVYTIGMRGEADTAILKGSSSLADNIELLRDVIRVQNSLIGQTLDTDPDDVPRLLVLYKEVEPFWYGDKNTPGLVDDPDLDGVTIMFSDDNFGNLRTVPDPERIDRRGGYGLYYHLDYHGWPISYEWFNTSYLPKIWEQVSSAYDQGIREMWVVNVGDIFTNEYPLAFILDMAYDFEKWGTSDRNSAGHYTDEFVRRHLPGLNETEKNETARLLLGYTKITGRRRTEAMNDDVYAPFAYGESERLIEEIDILMKSAANIYKKAQEESKDAFYELVYLPLTANLNIQKMWLLTGQNHAYAAFGSTYANTVADTIHECIKRDRKLVEKLHDFHKGKWYGMGMSEHIGFKNWCEEECMYPLVHTFEPADKPRLIVSIPMTGEHTEGGFWSGRTLTMGDTLDPLVCGGYIELSTASKEKVSYEMSSSDDFIDIISPGRSVKCGQKRKVFIFADRLKLDGREYAEGTVTVTSGEQKITVRIPVNNPVIHEDLAENTYLMCGSSGYDLTDCISIDATHFIRKDDTSSGGFEVIEGYGTGDGAVKAYPQNITFPAGQSPTVTYAFVLKDAGRYNVRFITSPANPCGNEAKLLFTASFGNGNTQRLNMIPEGFAVGDDQEMWKQGVLCNYRILDIEAELGAGANELTVGAVSPGFVLEKIIISPAGVTLPYSYLGPSETFRITH